MSAGEVFIDILLKVRRFSSVAGLLNNFYQE